MSKRKINQNVRYVYRMARMLYAIAYLGRYCNICGLDGFVLPWAIDFHHKENSDKKYEVKNHIYNGNFHSHKEELDKCMLLCSNCHRTNHSEKEKFEQNFIQIQNKLLEIKNNNGGRIRKSHFLTDEEKSSIINMVKEGFIMTDISKKLQLNYGTIKSFIRKHKLDPSKRTRVKIPWSIVLHMLNAKHSLRNIAKKININRETLRQHLDKNIECEIFNNGIKRFKLRKL